MPSWSSLITGGASPAAAARKPQKARQIYTANSCVSPAAATAMISILLQERLLGFTLGSVSMGGYVLHQRRSIYRSLAEAEGTVYSYQPCEINSRKGSTELAHVWNKAVDETLGRLLVCLSSREW